MSTESEADVPKKPKKEDLGDEAVAVSGLGNSSAKVKLVARSPAGRIESETTVRGGHSNRYFYRMGGMLHVSWDNFSQFSHVHCKTRACDNNWKAKSGSALVNQFEVVSLGPGPWRITCKKCGRTYESG